MSEHNGSDIEARLHAVPSVAQAAEGTKTQLSVPCAMALNVFGVVIAAMEGGAGQLLQVNNKPAADILKNIAEELVARTKQMILEDTRRVQLYAQAPPA